ncbi:hypothetical protein UPYG_G00234520 [Umbra pygmaea]|uniref:Membrane-anchored junction protein n=1 Tax=Umbra pygmaea TaxID=75934 RepID=A0ABD0WE23_UMBPY
MNRWPIREKEALRRDLLGKEKTAWTMPIRSFSFPLPETRFFQAGRHVYKFKIRNANNCSEVDLIREEFLNHELENAIRSVLDNLDALQPFTTKHFIVYPYKSKWRRLSELRFETLSGEKLPAYPYLITLYIEPNPRAAKPIEESSIPSSPEPQSKRSKTEQPQRGAIVQQHRCREIPDIQGPQSQINQELLRQEETKTVYDKEVWEIFGSLTPQSSVGSSFTGGSGTTGETGNQKDKKVHHGIVESDVVEPTISPDFDRNPEPSVRTCLMSRLARQVFPFSMFFKKS